MCMRYLTNNVSRKKVEKNTGKGSGFFRFLSADVPYEVCKFLF